jgi:DNA-binding transcriptional ArsR family regulator
MSSRAAARNDEKLDAVFSALGDPTRRRILVRLASGPAFIGELAEPFAMTLPAVSKHLRVLERAGLMRRERDGWYHRCFLEPAPLESAASFLARYQPFWEQTLEQLARYVEEPSAERTQRRKNVESPSVKRPRRKKQVENPRVESSRRTKKGRRS